MELEFLKKAPIFWSRLGFGYDPAATDSNGNPVAFTEDFSEFENYHKMFSDKNIKVHTSILHSGWVGADKYNYTLTDKTLDSIFSVAEDILYIPRVKLNAPLDWCKENPNDVFLYEDAPRNPEEISALVGTPKHDILGYEAPNGYYRATDDIGKRPNVGGVISRQSIASEKWLEDAGIALKKLIDYIENGKYADKIIGYMVSFGPSGECMHWGRASNHYGDYGIECLKQFYDYGIKKYLNRDMLAQVWDQPDISRENLTLPSADERYNNYNNLCDIFRGKEEDRIKEDYDEFLSKTVADAIEYFGKITKENTGDKLVGVFYGYFIHVGNASYAGHLEIERLLDSPYVDFFAAPMPYYRRNPGEPSGCMSATQSINEKKLWIEEIDCRTYLEQTDDDDKWICKTPEGTYAALWREACKNISHDSGYWWMDLGGGWFNSPDIMDEIEKITNASEIVRKIEHKSISDVLVVLDEKSMYKTPVSEDLRLAFMEDFICEVHMTGAVADIYRLSDLPGLDLSQYKLIIFAYDFNITDELWKSIKIPKNTALMFNYAFGIWNDKFSVENVEMRTGFALTEYNDEKYSFPMLKTVDGKLVDTKNVNGRIHIINQKPFMPATELREIFKEAGVKIYAPKECTVYGDNRIFGIFSQKNVKGTLKMPKYDKYYEAVNDKVYEGDSFEIDMKENSALCFISYKEEE